jgi:TetR/AcrR family transcriptional regulator
VASDDGPYQPLPRGRHGLTREQVHDSQRVRLLHGMAATVAERGYPRTTVADVLKRARVSRDTFYQLYTGKEDCFLDVLDGSAQLLAQTVASSVSAADANEPVLQVLERALTTYFSTLIENEPTARVFFVESYAAGLPAQHKRVEVQERFVALLTAALADAPELRAVPDLTFACRLIVGGISALVSAALVHDEIDTLKDAGPKVIAFLHHVVGAT